MTALLLRFLPHLIVAAIAATAGALASRVYYVGQIKSLQAAQANERAANAVALAQEQARNRDIEQSYQRQRSQAEADHAKALVDIQRRLVVAASERVRLQADIRRYTSSSPADPACTAERDRAETLGLLLGQATERAERDARELEELNSEKIALLAAWPRSPGD